MLIRPLYGNRPEAGIRELLQNAVDAVGEMKLYQQCNPDIAGELTAQDADVVVLRSSEEDGSHWGTIANRGIGMTPQIILLHIKYVPPKSLDLLRKPPGEETSPLHPIGPMPVGAGFPRPYARGLMRSTRRSKMLQFDPEADEFKRLAVAGKRVLVPKPIVNSEGSQDAFEMVLQVKKNGRLRTGHYGSLAWFLLRVNQAWPAGQVPLWEA